MQLRTKKGQVWIETVLYTLIGLTLIAITLAFVMPKINESRDRAIVQQTVNSLNLLDEKINAILEAPGNKRPVEILIRRGEMLVDSRNDTIEFIINDLEKPYSEVGTEIKIGRITLLSEEGQKKSIARLKLNYSGDINLTYAGSNQAEKKFTSAPTPYRFIIEYDGNSIVNIGEISGK